MPLSDLSVRNRIHMFERTPTDDASTAYLKSGVHDDDDRSTASSISMASKARKHAAWAQHRRNSYSRSVRPSGLTSEKVKPLHTISGESSVLADKTKQDMSHNSIDWPSSPKLCSLDSVAEPNASSMSDDENQAPTKCPSQLDETEANANKVPPHSPRKTDSRAKRLMHTKRASPSHHRGSRFVLERSLDAASVVLEDEKSLSGSSSTSTRSGLSNKELSKIAHTALALSSTSTNEKAIVQTTIGSIASPSFQLPHNLSALTDDASSVVSTSSASRLSRAVKLAQAMKRVGSYEKSRGRSMSPSAHKVSGNNTSMKRRIEERNFAQQLKQKDGIPASIGEKPPAPSATRRPRTISNVSHQAARRALLTAAHKKIAKVETPTNESHGRDDDDEASRVKFTEVSSKIHADHNTTKRLSSRASQVVALKKSCGQSWHRPEANLLSNNSGSIDEIKDDCSVGSSFSNASRRSQHRAFRARASPSKSNVKPFSEDLMSGFRNFSVQRSMPTPSAAKISTLAGENQFQAAPKGSSKIFVPKLSVYPSKGNVFNSGLGDVLSGTLDETTSNCEESAASVGDESSTAFMERLLQHLEEQPKHTSTYGVSSSNNPPTLQASEDSPSDDEIFGDHELCVEAAAGPNVTKSRSIALVGRTQVAMSSTTLSTRSQDPIPAGSDSSHVEIYDDDDEQASPQGNSKSGSILPSDSFRSRGTLSPPDIVASDSGVEPNGTRLPHGQNSMSESDTGDRSFDELDELDGDMSQPSIEPMVVGNQDDKEKAKSSVEKDEEMNENSMEPTRISKPKPTLKVRTALLADKNDDRSLQEASPRDLLDATMQIIDAVHIQASDVPPHETDATGRDNTLAHHTLVLENVANEFHVDNVEDYFIQALESPAGIQPNGNDFQQHRDCSVSDMGLHAQSMLKQQFSSQHEDTVTTADADALPVLEIAANDEIISPEKQSQTSNTKERKKTEAKWWQKKALKVPKAVKNVFRRTSSRDDTEKSDTQIQHSSSMQISSPGVKIIESGSTDEKGAKLSCELSASAIPPLASAIADQHPKHRGSVRKKSTQSPARKNNTPTAAIEPGLTTPLDRQRTPISRDDDIFEGLDGPSGNDTLSRLRCIGSNEDHQQTYIPLFEAASKPHQTKSDTPNSHHENATKFNDRSGIIVQQTALNTVGSEITSSIFAECNGSAEESIDACGNIQSKVDSPMHTSTHQVEGEMEEKADAAKVVVAASERILSISPEFQHKPTARKHTPKNTVAGQTASKAKPEVEDRPKSNSRKFGTGKGLPSAGLPANVGQQPTRQTPASSMFVNLGCGIGNSLFSGVTTGVCQYPDEMSGLDFPVDIDTGMSYVSGSSSIGTGATDTSPNSLSQIQLTELEKRIWNDWENRNSSSNKLEPDTKTAQLVTETETETTYKRDEQIKRREEARGKLLNYATSAISKQMSSHLRADSSEYSESSYTSGESQTYGTSTTGLDTRGESMSYSEADTKTCMTVSSNVGSVYDVGERKSAHLRPISATPILLSASQNRLIEKFTKNLTNTGVEVLKLNTRKQWQVRFFTVSKEVVNLTAQAGTSTSADATRCPKCLLWAKKFTSKAGGYSMEKHIDKSGHGGMLIVDLKDVAVDDKPKLEKSIPSKLLDRYGNGALITLEYIINGSHRSTSFLCKDSDEAHFLCTCLRVMRDLLKRDRLQRRAA